MILRNWHLLLFFISIFSVSFALIAENFFGLQPCELCLKQRHPYYLFILVILLSFVFQHFNKFLISIFLQITVVYGLFYSIWHVGVENKLLDGPAGCSAGLSISKDTLSLKEQILNKQVISCDEVIWSFFGISAASINTILLIFIFIINGLYMYMYYVKKEKK